MYVPELGDRIPPWGSRWSRWLGTRVLQIFGWGFEGKIPNHGKMVIIGAPHTTAWDFAVGVMALVAIGMRVRWLGADWIFRFPFMRLLGGVPVDRSQRHDMVAQVIEKFEHQDQFILGLAPEGSRYKVVPWKSGFYHVAHGAKVPLLLGAFDWRNKRIRFGPSFTTSGDLEADMEKIRPFYAEYLDQHPERFGM